MIIKRYINYIYFFIGSILLLRYTIYYFQPETIRVKGIIKFIVTGTLSDLLPILIFYTLFLYSINKKLIQKKFIFYFFVPLFYIYYMFILLSNIINIALLVESKTILTPENFINIYPHIFHFISIYIYYIISIFMFISIFVYLILKRMIIHINYLESIPKRHIYFFLLFIFSSCLIILIYEKDYRNWFARGYRRTEWIARPVYKNTYLIFKKYMNHETLVTTTNNKFFNETFFSNEDNKYLSTVGLTRNNKQKVNNFNNIIIVAVESLDLNYLHSINKNIPPEATKNIDSLYKNFTSFTNFYTSNQPTSNGIHALLASRLDRTSDSGYTPNLFTEFASHGFETYFLSACPGYYENTDTVFSQIYLPQHALFAEFFENTYDYKTSGWGVSSNFIFDETIKILKDNSENNKFIFISTIDTHPPYAHTLPKNDICLSSSNTSKSKFILSLCSIDRAIGDFILKVDKFLDNTLIIITSDHSATHGENFTQRNEYIPDRIPLIFITKRQLPEFGDVSNNYFSQIDLPVTLLNLQGISIPNTFMGNDLRYQKNAISYISEHIIRLKTHHDEQFINIFDQKNSSISKWYSQYYNF